MIIDRGAKDTEILLTVGLLAVDKARVLRTRGRVVFSQYPLGA